MPQVPTYGAPKVARDPRFAAKLDPVQSNAGETIGNALNDLGGALEQTGEVAHRYAEAKQSEIDRQAQAQSAARIEDAKLNYRTFTVGQLYDPNTGLISRQGKAAQDYSAAMDQAFADKRKDLLSGFNPAEQRILQRSFEQSDLDATEFRGKYLTAQGRVALDQSDAAQIESFKQQAPTLHDANPAQFQQNHEAMHAAQLRMDLRNGATQAQHVANNLKNSSDYNAGVIGSRLAAGDDQGARRFFDEVQSGLLALHRLPLLEAVTNAGNAGDARRFVEGALKAGLAGWSTDAHGAGDAPPVGVNRVVEGIRRITRDLGASPRETERVVGRALSGGVDGVDVAAAPAHSGDAGEQGRGAGAALPPPQVAAVKAAVAQDRDSHAAAKAALGRPPHDWEVGLVTDAGRAAGAALLAASPGAGAGAVLAGAGLGQAAAAEALARIGAAPDATVSQALHAARASHGEGLAAAVGGHAAGPQSQLTPDAVPDRATLVDLARHAAGPDPRRQDAFVGEANTTADEAEAAAERKRREPLEAVYDLLKAGVPYSRFPADKRAALDPRDAQAFAAGEANPPPKEGDPALLMQIRRMYAEADPGFRTLNPSDFANLLNPDQMGQLAGWLDDVRQNGANGPTPDQIKAHRVLAAADDAAAGAVAAQGGAGADTPRSVEAAPDAPGPAAMDTVARAEDGSGGGTAPASLYNVGAYQRGPDYPAMLQVGRHDAPPTDASAYGRQESGPIRAAYVRQDGGYNEPNALAADAGLMSAKVAGAPAPDHVVPTQQLPAQQTAASDELVVTGQRPISKKARRRMDQELKQARRNQDDDPVLEPPQERKTVEVQGQKFVQVHASRDYDNVRAALRAMVNIPKRFSDYDHQEYSGRLEYDPATKKYKFYLYEAMENTFHLFLTRNAVAFWHLHPERGGASTTENMVLSGVYKPASGPDNRGKEGTDIYAVGAFTRGLEHTYHRRFPGGVPTLLTTPTGSLIYYPNPMVDSTHPITVKDYSIQLPMPQYLENSQGGS